MLQRILGSRAKIALLGALVDRDGRTGRALSAAAGVSASTGKEALGDLVRAGVVFQSGTSGRHQYDLNRSHEMCRHLEQLVVFERSAPQRVARLVCQFAEPHALVGVAIEAGTVTLYGTESLRLDEAARERLARTIHYSLGLTLDAVITDGSVPAPGPGRWIRVGTGAVGAPSDSRRESMLGFFGLDKRTP